MNIHVPIAPPMANNCTSFPRSFRWRACEPAATAVLVPLSKSSPFPWDTFDSALGESVPFSGNMSVDMTWESGIIALSLKP